MNVMKQNISQQTDIHT